MSESKIIEVRFGARVPDDLPSILRELADAAERGDLKAMVFAYLMDGDYITRQSTTPHEAVVLSTILQSACVEKFRGG